MATKVDVKRALTTMVDTYDVEGKPQGLSDLVNDAVRDGNKFVTFTRDDGNEISVIAANVTDIYEK